MPAEPVPTPAAAEVRAAVRSRSRRSSGRRIRAVQSPRHNARTGFRQVISRADARIRTADPFITSEVLYQLSYVGGENQSSRLLVDVSGAGIRKFKRKTRLPNDVRTSGVDTLKRNT